MGGTSLCRCAVASRAAAPATPCRMRPNRHSPRTGRTPARAAHSPGTRGGLRRHWRSGVGRSCMRRAKPPLPPARGALPCSPCTHATALLPRRMRSRLGWLPLTYRTTAPGVPRRSSRTSGTGRRPRLGRRRPRLPARPHPVGTVCHAQAAGLSWGVELHANGMEPLGCMPQHLNPGYVATTPAAASAAAAAQINDTGAAGRILPRGLSRQWPAPAQAVVRYPPHRRH